jgi:hypothetical protein
MVAIFEPYVDNTLSPTPIEIRSGKQRDEFLASKGYTLDSVKYTKPKKKSIRDIPKDVLKKKIYENIEKANNKPIETISTDSNTRVI